MNRYHFFIPIVAIGLASNMQSMENFWDYEPNACPTHIASVNRMLHFLKKKIDTNASVKELQEFYVLEGTSNEPLLNYMAALHAGAGNYILEYMLQKKADPNEKKLPYSYPLFSAITAKNSTAVQLLLTHGATICSDDESHDCKFGSTPLLRIVSSDSIEQEDVAIVKMLLEANKDAVINKKGRSYFKEQKYNDTALRVIVERLMCYPSSLHIDRFTETNKPFLHKIMTLLLEHGENPHVQNADKESAIDYINKKESTKYDDLKKSILEKHHTFLSKDCTHEAQVK